MYISKIRDSNILLTESVESTDLSDLHATITNHTLLILEEIFAIKQADPLNGLYDREKENEILSIYLKRNLQFPKTNKKKLPLFSVVGNVHELLTYLNNSIQMVYDLGCAYHSKMFVLKEQILDILIASFDGKVEMKVNQIFVSVNGKLDNCGERLQKKVSILVDKIFWELDNYLPYQESDIPRLVYRSVWLKKKTFEIAQLTKGFYLNEKLSTKSEQVKLKEGDRESINYLKIGLLSNLLKSRFHQIDNAETVLLPIVEKMNWSERNKLKLTGLINARKLDEGLNLDLIRNKYFSELVLTELAIWVRRKKEIDRGERLYLYQIAKDLGYDYSFVDGLIF